jgi:hypothetical protein
MVGVGHSIPLLKNSTIGNDSLTTSAVGAAPIGGPPRANSLVPPERSGMCPPVTISEADRASAIKTLPLRNFWSQIFCRPQNRRALQNDLDVRNSQSLGRKLCGSEVNAGQVGE